MADSTAPLELPLGVTENKVLQQIARIEAQLRKVQRGAQQDFVRSNAKVAQSFSAISGAAQGMSRSTVASLQNVSYQLQDIFVQIQGGQGALRAFGQQMPQLLGGFGFAGAVAGLAAAIGTSLIPVLLGAGEEAEEFGKQVERLNSLLKTQQEVSELSARNMADLQKEFGTNAVLARQLADALGDIAKLEFLQQFEATKAEVSQSVDVIRSLVREMDEAMASGAPESFRLQTIQALRDEYGLTEAQARRVTEALDAMDAATGPAAAAQAALELTNALTQARDEGARIPDAMLESAKQAGELAQVSLRAAAALGDTATAAETLAQVDATPNIAAAAGAAGVLAEKFREALGYAQSLGGFSPDLNRFGVPTALLGPGYMPSSPRPQPAPSGIGGIDWGTPPKRGGGGKSEAEKEHNKLLREKEQILKDLQSPAEKYAAELKRIQLLQSKGLLTQEQADAARQRLESLQPAAQQLRSALQSAFDGVFDDPEQALRELAEQLGRMALNMQLMKWFPNVFGAQGMIPLVPNANGGVYSGHGISSYSGQVVSKPTVFPFAKGIGLMGEAGPEAILPLTRINGKLGVQSSGRGGAGVQIIDQRSAGAPDLKTETTRGPDGREMIRVIVGEQLVRGQHDKSMQGRFGARPQKVVR